MSWVPLLDEIGERFDWPKASLRTSVTVGPGEASVQCLLHQAPALQAALVSGQVTYAAELRAPKSLYSRLIQSATPDFKVRWNEAEVTRELYITAGVVAVDDFQLSAADLHRGTWEESEVPIPAGSWLALGKRRARDSVSASLLTFRLDSRLGAGRMRVADSMSDGSLRFTAWLAADLFERRVTSRDVQIAALVAACAQLPDHAGESEEAAPAVVLAVKRLLEDASVPTWEEDGWNPALAATALEPFRTAETEDDDE